MATLLTATKTHTCNKTYHLIVGEPSDGSFGDYLLLKNKYRSLDKDYDWRYVVATHIIFLRKYKKTYGELTCSFCGEKHLVIVAPHSKKVSDQIKATVDHFFPTSLGGLRYDENNFVVSCAKCNSKKSNKIYDISSLKYAPKEIVEKIKKYLKKNHK